MSLFTFLVLSVLPSAWILIFVLVCECLIYLHCNVKLCCSTSEKRLGLYMMCYSIFMSICALHVDASSAACLARLPLPTSTPKLPVDVSYSELTLPKTNIYRAKIPGTCISRNSGRHVIYVVTYLPLSLSPVDDEKTKRVQ
jgi:hypothetical protein